MAAAPAKLDMALGDIINADQKSYGKAPRGRGGRGGRGRGRGGRSQPYENRQQRAPVNRARQTGAPAYADFSNQQPVAFEKKVIMVSSKADVRQISGAIAHTVRAGDAPTLMATGVDSINHTIKAIATARQYLEENKLDFTCQPVFRSVDKGAFTFLLTKTALRAKKPDEKETKESTLRVAANSDPAATAGAIAGKIRAGERVVVQSIGPGSVDAAVRAITMARRYLDQDALDLAFRAEWVHIKVENGEERSAIQFFVLAHQI